MKRRAFLQATTASSALIGTSVLAHAANANSSADYYELRTYHLDSLHKLQLVSNYIENAALPAWKRLQIGPVGAFTEIGEAPSHSLHVLLTYSSLDQFATARPDVEADPQYQTAALDYLNATLDNPAFTRIESSLLVAFAGMPKIAPPQSATRVLELRTYESHSESKARRKIDMFNEGEIPIFQNNGLTPVFFGETLIGPRTPNLKYMLATDTLADSQAGWKNFLADPDFVTMKDLPRYADTVSKIENLYLSPTDYSEL